ncbi:hypothetical protein U9M48_036356 [Paspalum notatum var. saurae]|uniref:Uncharacterized protein n=1 Tax=Paspalum notatum var. saurae TaxID=547442 RepID=A0AAQ3UH16_PASNO
MLSSPLPRAHAAFAICPRCAWPTPAKPTPRPVLPGRSAPRRHPGHLHALTPPRSPAHSHSPQRLTLAFSFRSERPHRHCRSSESELCRPLRCCPRPQITAITSASTSRVQRPSPRRLPSPPPPERSVPAVVAAAASARHRPPRVASHLTDARLARPAPPSTFPAKPRSLPPPPLPSPRVTPSRTAIAAGPHRGAPPFGPTPHLQTTSAGFASSPCSSRARPWPSSAAAASKPSRRRRTPPRRGPPVHRRHPASMTHLARRDQGEVNPRCEEHLRRPRRLQDRPHRRRRSCASSPVARRRPPARANPDPLSVLALLEDEQRYPNAHKIAENKPSIKYEAHWPK